MILGFLKENNFFVDLVECFELELELTSLISLVYIWASLTFRYFSVRASSSMASRVTFSSATWPESAN